jgi:hypothetical protein
LTPAGGDHDFDEGFLEGSFGLESGEEGVVEGAETVLRLDVENEGTGEQAVLVRVAGGVEFAGGRDWSAGFGAVDAGGVDLRFSSHANDVAQAESSLREIGGNLVDLRENIVLGRW